MKEVCLTFAVMLPLHRVLLVLFIETNQEKLNNQLKNKLFNFKVRTVLCLGMLI